MSQAQGPRGPVAVFGILPSGTNGPFQGPWKHLAVRTRPTIAFGGGQVYCIGRSGG